MPAKIIELNSFRSRVRAQNGVRFPSVYRLDGFSWRQKIEGDDQGGFEPSDEANPPLYTLGDTTSHPGYAKPHWTPITTFSGGWLIVRHHATWERADGYSDALWDSHHGTEDGEHWSFVYRTDQGLFTLLRISPTEEKPKDLLIYITKEAIRSGPFAGNLADTHHIVHSDGSVSSDSAILYPEPEDD